MANDRSRILVVGGGIAGITAAIEAAEVGHDVILVERNPYLGGRVAQMFRYFPKLCPPSCGLEINFQRILNNPRIQVFTQATVAAVSGSEGAFGVEVELAPRFVNDKCTACGACAEACEQTIDNPFNYGLDQMKAAYQEVSWLRTPYSPAFPSRCIRTVASSAFVSSTVARQQGIFTPFRFIIPGFSLQFSYASTRERRSPPS